MIKLHRARSLLYRRQILQDKFLENIRWKTLDEIYKMYMFLHRSDLNIKKIQKIFVKVYRIFPFFRQKFAKFTHLNLIFEKNPLTFAQSLINFVGISKTNLKLFRKC